MKITDIDLEKIFTDSGIVDQKTIDRLKSIASDGRISLYQAALESNILPDEKLGQIIAKSYNLPFITLSRLAISKDVLTIIPERIARQYKIIPFSLERDSVKVASVNPNSKHLVDMIEQKTGQRVILHFATEKDINEALQLYKKDLQKTIQTMLTEGADGTSTYTSDLPIAKMVDLLITHAYRDKASDIHIEPEENNVLIRFRIDGILRDTLYLKKNVLNRIVTRIKVLSNIPTDEHLRALDGKMRLYVDEEHLDIRVSIIPVADGEKVVLRLLSSKFRPLSLLDLGMSNADLKKVDHAVRNPYGMILSTGPTGSGKTTSIYSILKTLNTREKNITTIEDPIEYRIKGVNQIQLNSKADLTFAQGLRSILRQDPDTIFVGEIRDSETAGIAVNAALTGHVVLSTLHTNDAATALPRFIDMKVEPFLVAATVNIVIAQRLVRKICPECKAVVRLTKVELRDHISEKMMRKHFGTKKSITLYRGKGCKKCHLTGYVGRIGIFEVMEMSEHIKRLIIDKKDSDSIKKQAINEGMTSMLDDGIKKALSGVTTIEEVLRVTKTEPI